MRDGGKGTVSLDSSGLGNFGVSWAARTEGPGGQTSPEELIAAAHSADVGVQSAHGVRFLTYWFEADSGAVFCLAEGPSIEAVEQVHREAHGQLAASIIEVSPRPP